MRYVVGMCTIFLLFCSALAASAQVLPTTGGSCSVSATGVMGCESLSTPPLKKADGARDWSVRNGHPQLFVTEFKLSPGATLNRMAQGQDVLIIGMEDGELLNETKSPPLRVDLRNDSVVLMPKEELYSLRNIGKKDVHFLVVHTRR
jgi:hypothetical protein